MARNRLVWLVCLSILWVVPASATLETYTTLAAWELAATQSGVTIDFSTVSLTGGSSALYSSLPIGGVTFTSPSDWVQVYNIPGSAYYDWGTGSILRTYDDNRGVVAAWASPITAFAASMGITAMSGGGPVASQMVVTARRGETVVWESPLVTSARPALTFFGIVSTDPAVTFDSVTFTPPAFNQQLQNYTTAYLDDVRLGEYNAPSGETPELGTGVLSLCGGILLAAGGFRRHVKPS